MRLSRYEVVNLDQPPTFILTGDISIQIERSEFIQTSNLWTLYFYQHDNVLTINSCTYPVHRNDVGIVPPGARVSHAVLGDGKAVNYLSFDMPGTSGIKGAVPHVLRNMEGSRPQWVSAGNRLVDSTVFMRAFVWNFICQAAQSLAIVRADAILYEAEDWIRKNLSQRFTIAEMCEELAVSSRHLLRAFRGEHGVTVQEYIIRRRIQEAARLLIGTDLPPKIIAAQVGIPDLQHFNKLIRQHTGVSPREFRVKADLSLWK